MSSKIYKITNLINGKIYVGYTKKELKERFNEHCKPRSKGALKMPIVMAIKKYGIENFKIELLEESENDEYIHEEREKYWINVLQATNNKIGYNLAAGGNGCGFYYWNNGIKNKRSKECPGKNWIRGMLVTEESRKLRSDAHKGQQSAFKGKKHTKEAKEKLSKSHKNIFNGANNPAAKVVKIISPDGIEYIVKGTIREFCKKYQLSYAMYKKYKNKGPCKVSKYISKNNKIAKNTEGWIFILLD